MAKLFELTEKTTLVSTDMIYLVQSPYGSGDDRKATVENLGNAVGRYVDRGDVAYDWTVGNFTKDSAWHDLDCSAIVPAGAKMITLGGNIKADQAYADFSVRKKGTASGINQRTRTTQVINVGIDFCFRVPCSTARVIEYFLANVTPPPGSLTVTWGSVNVAIFGWEF